MPPGARFSPRPSDGRPLSLPGADHRYMSSYTNSYGSEWSTPDTMKRYSMYLTPKGKRERLPLGAMDQETQLGSALPERPSLGLLFSPAAILWA